MCVVAFFVHKRSSFMENHKYFMLEALRYAKMAFEQGEVPIGAVVVYDNQIIGFGYNKRQNSKRVHAHAEIEAMNMASNHLNSWNLENCTLYVNIEPCPMCAGAMIQSHVSEVVYGAGEPNSGSLGSVTSMHEVEGFNHKIKVIKGVMQDEASDLMKTFFTELRKTKLKIKRVDEEIFKDCLKLRVKVFVEEQGVSLEEEIDEYDDLSREDVIHIAAIKDKTVLGTARFIIKGNEYKIGRVAVDKSSRGLNVGSELLKYIEKQAMNNGIHKMILGAQISAMPFYEKLGYTSYGEIFDDAGIDHLMMEKIIKKATFNK